MKREQTVTNSKARLIFAVFVLISVSSCSNNYNRIETGGTERTSVRLNEDVAVLVTTPKDGGYGRQIENGSGVAAARTIDASFSRYARLVDVYPSEYHSLNELRDVIAKNGYGYIVVPTITVWGRKDNSWSKVLPTQVSVKISVIDAKTGREVSSNFLEGHGTSPSSFSSLFEASDERPEELLSDLSDDYVDTLYGALLRFPGK